MKVDKKGGRSFSFLKFTLSPGDMIITEPDAMCSMDSKVSLKSKFNGGLIKGLLMKFFAKESVFISNFSNKTENDLRITITNPLPGEIKSHKLKKGEELFIQPGAFIACTKGIKFCLSWAGFRSLLGGEGLFRIKISGSGYVWYGAYGAIVERVVDGEYIVDTGHLLSYPTDMKIKLQLSGGLFSSFFGGEGFVMRLEGKGTILLQTRSLGGLAGWLNPRFW